MEKKNKFFTLLFSCYPGGGHMYLGFMKQGVQLMFLFSIIAIISSYGYIFRSLSFFIPILIAYSIFDAMNKRNSMEEPNDSNLELFKWFNVENTGRLKAMNYYKVAVYILIITGVYILVDKAALGLVKGVLHTWFDGEQMNSFYMIEQALKSSILGIIFIIGGIKLREKLKESNLEEQEEQEMEDNQIV